MTNPKYVIFKDKGGDFRFNLKARNGQVILSSEGYESKSGCKNGISSVQKNCVDDNRFERKTAKNGKFYFVLKAKNGEPIGKSEMYNSISGRNNGIASVKTNGVVDKIEE